MVWWNEKKRQKKLDIWYIKIRRDHLWCCTRLANGRLFLWMAGERKGGIFFWSDVKIYKKKREREKRPCQHIEETAKKRVEISYPCKWRLDIANTHAARTLKVGLRIGPRRPEKKWIMIKSNEEWWWWYGIRVDALGIRSSTTLLTLVESFDERRLTSLDDFFYLSWFFFYIVCVRFGRDGRWLRERER